MEEVLLLLLLDSVEDLAVLSLVDLAAVSDFDFESEEEPELEEDEPSLEPLWFSAGGLSADGCLGRP